MKRSHFLSLLFGGGLLLLVLGLGGLRSQKDGLRYHQNPFAIQRSGYGKVLARLSQNSIDIAWHLGVEQINPKHCSDPNCTHEDHDHGHDHGDDDHPEGEHEDHDAHQTEVPEAELSLLEKAGIDVKSMHCDQCRKAAVAVLKQGGGAADALAAVEKHDDEIDDDVLALLPEPGHVHDEHCNHDHGHGSEGKATMSEGWLADSVDWLHDLSFKRYDRTNPHSISERHKLAITQDIADMMLRGYKMDPTDYGVYDGYFLFLTIHEFGGTPEMKEHARLVSRITVDAARDELEDPQPWLTAAGALLNLYFLDQADLKAKGQEAPVKMIEDYRQHMAYLLNQYAVVREKAKAEGRWEAISEARRDAMRDRERFAVMAAKQFDAMLARANAPKEGSGQPQAPVKESVAQGKGDLEG